MNKRGSISGWTETIILSMLFIALFSTVIVFMNGKYGTFGGNNTIILNTSAINPGGEFPSYTVTAEGQIKGGETEKTDEGLSLTNSWAIARGIFTVLWAVLSGAWIPALVSMMRLPIVVANVLRTIFVSSLVFAVVRLFFKVKA